MIVTPVRTIDELLAVVNARHGPGGHWHSRAGAGEADHDHLRRPADAVRFLADHDVSLPPTPPPAATLTALGVLAREVRDLASGRPEAWPGPALAALVAGATYRLDADGTLASTAADAWARLVDDLAATAVGLGQARDAVRACENPLCRFVFLDRSRNRSRRWCDMAACGNRAKLRRFRRRQTRPSDRPGRRADRSGTATRGLLLARRLTDR